MSYHHLTGEERYQISVLNKAGHSQVEIAELIGRSPATISRELRRNRGKRGYRGYRPKQAHRLACQRREVSAANARRVSASDWLAIEAKLREDWSPEQVSGSTGLASTETIYLHVYEDKRAGGDLHLEVGRGDAGDLAQQSVPRVGRAEQHLKRPRRAAPSTGRAMSAAARSMKTAGKTVSSQAQSRPAAATS